MGIRREDSGHGVATGFSLSEPAARALEGALAMVLAPACASCASVLDAPLSGPVCAACWASVPPLPLSWRIPHSTSIDAVLSAGAYDNALRNIIHAWKFEGRQGLARPLARLLRERCGEALGGVDLAAPVPMTPWRKWRRGFNQAEDLAAHLGLPVVRALARWRPRPAQATLPSSLRRLNLEAAVFVPPWRRAAIQGRVVLLVDDVVTTGATLESCGRALREAGAADVRAVTVARTLLRAIRAK